MKKKSTIIKYKDELSSSFLIFIERVDFMTSPFMFNKLMTNELERDIQNTLSKTNDFTPFRLNFMLCLNNLTHHADNNEFKYQNEMILDKNGLHLLPVENWFSSFYNDNIIPYRTFVYPYIYPIYHITKDINNSTTAMEFVPYIYPIRWSHFMESLFLIKLN